MTGTRLTGSVMDSSGGGAAACGPYWRTTADLANYDATYGECIGWKWDHVLAGLRQRRWTPCARTVID